MRLLQLIDLYFRVCAVYDAELIDHCFRHTKNGKQPDFTDAEVLTCYLFATGWQQCLGPKACYDYMKTHYLDCFPRLPSCQAFNRRLNGLADVLPLFVAHCTSTWLERPDTMTTSTIVTDSFPVVTGAGGRKPSSCTILSKKARCATKQMYYYGVKVHIGALEQAGTLPIPYYIVVSPATTHDKTAQQRELMDLRNATVVADKAYVDRVLAQQMQASNSELVTPPRFGRYTTKAEKQRHGAYHRIANTVVARARQSIETLFAWLDRHTDIERASRVRSYSGLLVHIFGKIAAAICRHKIAKV